MTSESTMSSVSDGVDGAMSGPILIFTVVLVFLTYLVSKFLNKKTAPTQDEKPSKKTEPKGT